MEKNTQCLVQACEALKLHYQFLDADQTLLKVSFPWGAEYFPLNRTPFNNEAAFAICRDKKYSYDLLHNVVKMPKTLAYMDINVRETYQGYRAFTTLEAIATDVMNQLPLPCIIKPNASALGRQVSLCHSHGDIVQALSSIFDQQSKEYDYIALAQSFISNKAEFRLVCAFGESVFAYRRGFAEGFNARYWEQGENPEQVTDVDTLERLHTFIKPIYDHLQLGFAGFDIMVDQFDELHLIELNSSPRFNHITKDNDISPVVKMYQRVLTLYMNKHSINNQIIAQ